MKRDETNTREGEGLLKQIENARLTSVQFILNYLILGFDESGALTTLVWPSVSERGTEFNIGMAGYRDRLCGLITQIVQSVSITDEEVITISFRNKIIVRIPLRDYKQTGERAIFNAPKHHHLYVW